VSRRNGHRAPALVTGGAGFVGTNVAARLLRAGRRVRILDDLSRPGVERNLRWLDREHGELLDVELADVCDAAPVGRAMRGVSDVFHFAAQVAVTTSIDEPMHDARVNLQGTLNVLESARLASRPPAIVFTSTNKVYGGMADVGVVERGTRYEPADPGLRCGIGERRPLSFCTPYGCSKGAADQYAVDYAATYGIPSVVLRMSCIYGPHQCGNEDQGWVAHFLMRAIDELPITIYGDGKQVRDVLFVEDLVDAMLLAGERVEDLGGRAFNIGGSARNAVSLLDVVSSIGELVGREPHVEFAPWRQGDQRWYVSDVSRFQAATGWRPRTSPREGLRRLHAWLRASADEPLPELELGGAILGHA
jgi:CDP-paratose 2-epimerase